MTAVAEHHVADDQQAPFVADHFQREIDRAAGWPSATGDVADFMNALPKYVFSRTLTKSDWNNTQMFGSDVPGTVARLKREHSKDIFLFGSADLAASLMPHGLIDEFRIAVNPIILGGGTPLFKHGERVKLKLIDSRTLSTGVVILRYSPTPSK